MVASGGSSPGAPVPAAPASMLSSITSAGRSNPIFDDPKTTVGGSSPRATIPAVDDVSGVKRILAGVSADPATSSAGPRTTPASAERLTRTGACLGSSGGSA